MIRKFLLLIAILFATNGFADLQKKGNPAQPDKICSSTECYTILKVLGEGVFGKVYAVQSSAGKCYAIKSYKSQKDTHLANHILGDAKREYMRGQLLNHANIVKTFDLFEERFPSDNHATYLVLELVEGKTIFGIPKRSLELNQALHSSLQLIDALRYALSQKLLHLDLHDNNIMLAHSSDAMVIDLASFYSFEEILNFATKEKDEEKPKAAKNQAVHAQVAHVQGKKLKQFFLQNPKLLKKIQKTNKKNKKDKVAKNAKLKKVEFDQKQMMPILSHYFNDITEVCVHLITKSDLSREEKLRLRTTIKMLAWNYFEDVDEDLVIPIDYYFDQLIGVLQS